MSELMPKMMKEMMGGGSPMARMMGMMMGGPKASEAKGFKPWEMCEKMMSSIEQSSEISTFATPEVRELFGEWARKINDEILEYLAKNPSADAGAITESLKISKNSTIYFLEKLAQDGKVNLTAKLAD
jgi:hypothetical protein